MIRGEKQIPIFDPIWAQTHDLLHSWRAC